MGVADGPTLLCRATPRPDAYPRAPRAGILDRSDTFWVALFDL